MIARRLSAGLVPYRHNDCPLTVLVLADTQSVLTISVELFDTSCQYALVSDDPMKVRHALKRLAEPVAGYLTELFGKCQNQPIGPYHVTYLSTLGERDWTTSRVT